MVGIPGRSKGCNTCIQRKIRCDQETPLCGNCRKSNRLCTGYKRRLGYVLSRDISLVDLAETSREDTTVTHHGRWRRTKSQQPPLATYRAAEPLPVWAESHPLLSLGRQISANTAFRQQLHYVFLNYNLPAEMLDKSRPKSVVTGNWLLQLQNVVIQSPALENSLAAFFAAQVGRKNNDMNLVRQSHSMYVGGLHRFQQDLRNPQTRLSDETLAACMTLSLYELMECPPGTPSAYMTHQRGAMMLLQLRGPDASDSPLGHSLFLGLRTQTIIGISVHRRETFLCRPEWMERPWKLFPKTPLEKLIDLLFDYSAILQQSDKVFHETNQTVLQNGFRDIITKCLKVESALRGLYGNFEKSVSGLLYWPELSTLESCLDDARLGKVFPVSFHFPVFFVAQVITTYWSCMMGVHYLLMYTYNKLATIESSTTRISTTDSLLWPTSAGDGFYSALPFQLRSHEHSNKWKTMARNICQSAEYFLQDKMGFVGPLAILTQLRGCKSCLESVPEDWSREIRWTTDILERIQKKFDFRVNNLFGE